MKLPCFKYTCEQYAFQSKLFGPSFISLETPKCHISKSRGSILFAVAFTDSSSIVIIAIFLTQPNHFCILPPNCCNNMNLLIEGYISYQYDIISLSFVAHSDHKHLYNITQFNKRIVALITWNHTRSRGKPHTHK